ncbi:Mu-like prophage I protein [Devosia enhydra]|uniref:Mu-like prophage I protein n=1 Tax=Devosia enhydra TaxID=665118 RepID=A0A1K2I0T3_9HYPH|nr:phage protease [Devosia enhydra]SFZ85994.1 Mu-like prophage I protein [Devosia enhydra]
MTTRPASPELMLSLHAAQPGTSLALCAALDMVAGDAPDWVHLLPAGDIRTGDGRGPYRVADAGAVIAASLTAGDRLVIDENHSTDLAAPQGLPAPAMGWVTSLQARADGIWGQVEWTDAGRVLVAGRAYRGISPAVEHDRTGRVIAIRRASLVNRPNIKGLTALHQETSMDLLARLRAALELADTTSEDAIVTAVISLHQGQQVALHAQLSPIAQAAGLPAGQHTVETIIGAVQRLSAGSDSETITALQSELRDVATQLQQLQGNTAREKAEAYVDAAILARRVGIKPMRERYITMHMADPKGTEELIGAMPTLGPSDTVTTPPPRDGEISLNASQLTAARLLGVDPKAYAETLRKEREAAEAHL